MYNWPQSKYDIVAIVRDEIDSGDTCNLYGMGNKPFNSHGKTIASAATATGNLVHITGTTTITAIMQGDSASRLLAFDSALRLTHKATALIFPMGDIAKFAPEPKKVELVIGIDYARTDNDFPPESWRPFDTRPMEDGVYEVLHAKSNQMMSTIPVTCLDFGTRYVEEKSMQRAIQAIHEIYQMGFIPAGVQCGNLKGMRHER